MSRESDIDTIMQLLQTPPWVKPEESRQRLATLSVGELSEIRAILVSISEQKPSPKWEEVLEKARSLSVLQPLLAEWAEMNKHIKSKGWLGAQ